MGLEAGDVVMVHSGWGHFEGFTGSPKDLLDVLHMVVGPGGTILMPTIPFGGSAIDYARTDPLFDPSRTPSAMGLLTEVFRRNPETLRSTHPTHSVAARGPMARPLLHDHHRADSPCGPGTPWQRLIDVDGKILFLGVSTDHNTFAHSIQALLEPEWADLDQRARTLLSGLTPERYAIRVRSAPDEEVVCQTRLFDRTHVRHIDNDRLMAWLRSSGHVAETTVKGVRFTAIPARRAFEEARRRARIGEFLVDATAMGISDALPSGS